jgi:hypothetical protein
MTRLGHCCHLGDNYSAIIQTGSDGRADLDLFGHSKKCVVFHLQRLTHESLSVRSAIRALMPKTGLLVASPELPSGPIWSSLISTSPAKKH